MSHLFHSFHIVTLSPWPLICGMLALCLIISFIIFFKFNILGSLMIRNTLIILIAWLWWRDITREARFLGDHSHKVQDGLKWGIRLFIFSEVLFFIAWFWAFFHHRSVPVYELGIQWPPLSIFPFNQPNN